MDPDSRHFQFEEGGFRVEAHCQKMGSDYLVSVWGGAPHIGAVAMAQPRASLADPDRVSATASVFCYVGHKEDQLAKEAAEQLAAGLNTKVVVAAGLHWDRLTESAIRQVVKNVRVMVGEIIKELKTAGPYD